MHSCQCLLEDFVLCCYPMGKHLKQALAFVCILQYLTCCSVHKQKSYMNTLLFGSYMAAQCLVLDAAKYQLVKLNIILKHDLTF